MKTKLFLFAMTIAVVLAACKGDDGPAGPQGTAGSNGAANVSTTNFTATPGAWNGSGFYKYIDVPVAALTDATKDLVMVYIQVYTGGSWWALPITNLYYNSDEHAFAFVNGTVTLSFGYTSAPTVTWNYRIVVVPPSIARENPDVDFNNYKEVQAAFNLPD